MRREVRGRGRGGEVGGNARMRVVFGEQGIITC